MVNIDFLYGDVLRILPILNFLTGVVHNLLYTSLTLRVCVYHFTRYHFDQTFCQTIKVFFNLYMVVF